MYSRLGHALVLGSLLLLPLGCGDDDPTAIERLGTLTIVTESVTDPRLTYEYSDTLLATGGDGNWTWAVTAGSLPAGLTLEEDGGRGAEITGTPTALGSVTLTVGVASADGQTDTQDLTINVVAGTLQYTRSTDYDSISGADEVIDAVLGAAYKNSLEALGGNDVYTWTLTDGALPGGLSLATNGDITGTPTDLETQYFTVQVASGDGQTNKQLLSLTVNAKLAVQTLVLPDVVGGGDYDTQLMATGGDGAYSWIVSQDTIIDAEDDTTFVTHLPKGLVISSGGEITGTVEEGGADTFTVFVEDGAEQKASRELFITVILAIETSSLPAGPIGVSYKQTLAAMGGDGDYTWTLASGALPAGLSLADSTGVISGKPTALGVGVFTVQVADGDGETATRVFSINVIAGVVTITSSSIADGELAVAYSETLTAVGGDGAYTWTLVDGAFPAGLSLATTGVLSGLPTALSTGIVTVRVVDGDGQTDTKEFSVSVNLKLAVTTMSLPNGTVGAAYGTISVEAVGGDGDYAWAITVGTLPAGLELDVKKGTISGTPTAAGASTFTVEVEDGNGRTETQALTITIS